MRSLRRRTPAARVLILCLPACLAAALSLPAGAGAATLQQLGTFDQPIFVTSDPANPNRIFVVERAGVIRLVEGGTTRTFADLRSVVRCCESERGLFSMAPAPDFPQSGLLYVHYTGEDGPGNLHVAELRASGDTAGIGTLRNLLTVPHSLAGNHNGGQLQFGPDGYLYIANGDGGAGQSANAQNTNNRLGKLLRIDPRPSQGRPYSIPQSNPFTNAPGADEIWAHGLRNPWRFSFDRQTGDLLIADVGGSAQEEVDFAPLATGLGRGANYGWDCREGFVAGPSISPVCPGLSGYTNPIFTYATHVGGTCAITGGYVVRDPSLGDLFGRYLYTDLCLGQVRSLIPGLPLASADRSEGLTVTTPVSFGEDSCGRLYLVEQATDVYRIAGDGSLTCAVLRVKVVGPKRGTVTGPGIDCPGDCLQVFPTARSVRLRKHLGKRSNFSGWLQDCKGRRRCILDMSSDRQAGAKFTGPLRTRVRLKASQRRIRRGTRVLLRARARPCKGRRGDRVRLYRAKRRIATKRLTRRCRVRFHPRVGHRARFRVKVPADRRHRAGRSRPVTVFPNR